MAFGLSAAAIAGIASTAIAAGTAVYSAKQQKKGLAAQTRAIQDAQKKDAEESASAETGAAVAANQALADSKRRRRASALSAGAGEEALGGTSVLGAGSQPLTVSAKSTSALGKGAV